MSMQKITVLEDGFTPASTNLSIVKCTSLTSGENFKHDNINTKSENTIKTRLPTMQNRMKIARLWSDGFVMAQNN